MERGMGIIPNPVLTPHINFLYFSFSIPSQIMGRAPKDARPYGDFHHPYFPFIFFSYTDTTRLLFLYRR